MISFRFVFFHPGEQRRSEIETGFRIVVDDLRDPIFFVENPRGTVWSVALGCDALIPVVVGPGGVLALHSFQPRILARRLIAVRVDADEAFHECLRGSLKSAFLARLDVNCSLIGAPETHIFPVGTSTTFPFAPESTSR